MQNEGFGNHRTSDGSNNDPVFLKTKRHTFHYSNLHGFSLWLEKDLLDQNIIPTDDHPILLFPDQSEETVFLIAAAFLMKIPLMVLHPDTEKGELEQILEIVRPAAQFRGRIIHSDITKNIPRLNINQSHINIYTNQADIDFESKFSGTIAGYFMTSGSTAKPKIVPVSFEQVKSASESSARNFKPDVNKYWLLCLPLNHIGGMNVIYRSLTYGSAIYFAEKFDPGHIRSLLNDNKSFEAASMVSTMLNELLDGPFFRLQFDFKGLLVGGGPISSSLIDRALTRGIPVVTSYGMTETCAQIAANPMLRSGGTYIPKTSAGPVFRPNEVEIRNESGEKLRYNEPGLIWLRGPQVFKGYLNKEHNRKVFDDDGWFNTGDYGHLNRNGHLFIEARRTDLIITGGENVNPSEIETILNQFPSISESAVIGVPDQKWGQRVVAFIQPESENKPDIEQIRAELKDKIRGFKVPKEFLIIDRIPKTETQKIQRSRLAESYKSRMK